MKYLLHFTSGKFSFLLESPDFSLERSQITASKLCSEGLWMFFVIQSLKFKLGRLLHLSQLAQIYWSSAVNLIPHANLVTYELK